ncbi:hypothetical protein GCM10009682_13130 [Luedemannella flava]|uniref:Secreted protein n=1 Tax=Luedemannella flava TaxID=349316 RepID=A0ABP4XVH0_9ACTN
MHNLMSAAAAAVLTVAPTPPAIPVTTVAVAVTVHIVDKGLGTPKDETFNIPMRVGQGMNAMGFQSFACSAGDVRVDFGVFIRRTRAPGTVDARLTASLYEGGPACSTTDFEGGAFNAWEAVPANSRAQRILAVGAVPGTGDYAEVRAIFVNNG